MALNSEEIINQKLKKMEEKLSQSLLAEILEDIQNVKIDTETMNGILQHHSKLIHEFNDYLANFKIDIPQEKLIPFLNGLNRQIVIFKEMLNQQQKNDLEAKEKRLKFIMNRVFLIIVSSVCAVSITLFGFKSLQDRAKYKNLYDYIYYTQPQSRPYLQSLKVDFQNDSIKKAMRFEIKEIKKSEGKSNE